MADTLLSEKTVDTTTTTTTADVKTDAKTTDVTVDTTKTTDKVDTTKVEDPKTTATTDAAPAYDWRKEIAGDDEKLLKDLERTPDLKALHKRLADTQTALRDSGRVKVPGKDATPEEIATFTKAIGVPKDAAGYKIDLKTLLPDGMTLDDSDKASLKKITEKLFAEGGLAASPATVTAAHKLYIDLKEEELANQLATEETTRKTTEKELRGEWGAGFNANMGFAKAAVMSLFGQDKLEEVLNTRLADGSLMGDYKPFMKAMMQAGQALAQDPLFLPTSQLGGDPKSWLERKTEIMSWRNGSPSQRRQYDIAAAEGAELDTLNAKILAAKSPG